MSNQLPPLATPAEVANYLRTTTAALALESEAAQLREKLKDYGTED